MIPQELAGLLSSSEQIDTGVLVSHLGEFAWVMLNRNHAFLPAAAAISTAGELESMATPPAGFAGGPQMFRFLITAARGSREAWRCAAFAVAVVNPDYGDALEFHVDFALSETAIVALLPYRAGGLWREPKFGDLLVQPLPKFLWEGP
jgi:hypothetical protein